MGHRTRGSWVAGSVVTVGALMLGCPGQPPCPDCTALKVIIERKPVGAGNPVFEEVVATVEFLADVGGITILPTYVDACEAGSQIAGVQVDGVSGAVPELGEAVTLASISSTTTFMLSMLENERTFGSSWVGIGDPVGPWSASATYDVTVERSGVPVTYPGVIQVPDDRLQNVVPGENAAVDLTNDVEVTWDAGDAFRVVVRFSRGGSTPALTCTSLDDGRMDITASELAEVAGGVGDLELTVTKIYSTETKAAGEVVYGVVLDTLSHPLTP